jgi:hypothetical protein
VENGDIDCAGYWSIICSLKRGFTLVFLEPDGMHGLKFSQTGL